MSQINSMRNGDCWVYKIIPDIVDFPFDKEPTNFETNLDWCNGVGTVCLWRGSYKDTEVTEIGYGVTRAYQGRGFGTMAVQLILQKAKEAGNWGTIHCFTSVNNTASNNLVKKAGFEFLECCYVAFDGRDLKSNHYTYLT